MPTVSSLAMSTPQEALPRAADTPAVNPSSRVRTSSAPQHVRNHLSTATFQRAPPLSPLRTSFHTVNGHSRGKSSSTISPYPPPPSFMTTSHSVPEAQPHHHRRIHSRNLSIFFPRPGGSPLPTSTISEDGSQELSIPVHEDAGAPTSSVAVARSRHGGPITPLGHGFTFGSRPPGSADLTAAPRTTSSSSSSTTSRRGHHHKHSLSHNFFSFLEPTVDGGLSNNSPNSSSSGSETELHTQPTPTPISPWNLVNNSVTDSASSPPPIQEPLPLPLDLSRIGLSAPLSVSFLQFTLGASLWARGQQIGSLACTGLGYWVVFDAFGVMLSEVVPVWLASSNSKGSSSSMVKKKIRRPYGNGRLKTVLMFAQAVYLMFAAVYVCKETVEHILLGMGEGEGHHHHAAEDVSGLGLDFPIFMTFIAFVSVLGTATLFNNNSKIVNITGNRISLSHSFFHPFKSSWSSRKESFPSTRLGIIFSNPFIASPLLFCTLILSVALFVHPTHHRIADLVLALLIALVTFKVAYRASVVLGTVLLQTSPPRGRSGWNEDGLKMDAFWGAVREVERHPHVLDLPAPHIWQLTPSLTSASWMMGGSKRHLSNPEDEDEDSFVVALEIHVKEDLGDDELIKLTEWVWKRCVGALGGVREGGGGKGEGGPEVTIGVVRG